MELVWLYLIGYGVQYFRQYIFLVVGSLSRVGGVSHWKSKEMLVVGPLR